jgi:3-deoxy-D-manno-octulosonic acid kinase
MHDAGVNHTDLNIHNILLDDKGMVWIIDFDKCFNQSGDGFKQSNLQRLLRSFQKETLKNGIHWQRENFTALMSGYETVE